MTRPFRAVNFYGKRLALAIEYIDKNLAEPLSLAALSAKAAFSPNHFHKLFTQWMGETPQAYLRRCRLERAAALLHYGPDLTIKEIAPKCGFQSPEAFDRAFHAYFGMTPTEWRTGGYADWNKSSARSASVPLMLSDDQVQIKVFQSCRVIYKRKVGPYTDGEDTLWSELADLIAPLHLRNENCYGMGLDDPAVTPLSRCRFDACIQLPSLQPVPSHVPVRVLPGGYHAILQYSGPAGNTASHWTWLLQSWLPKSGFKISQNACFEYHPLGIPKAGMRVNSQLCLPLVR